jgi:hypothetical protein
MNNKFCYIAIPGNPKGKRIGIVVLGESGCYGTDFDHHETIESAKDHVELLNERIDIPRDVAQSMFDG